ncbi:MAG TPA: hypothetical protein VFY64_08580, partial [Nitrososphaeraceae archaeon]|nr:hypothetical protein [Nitrososphaeraceae archaeon]
MHELIARKIVELKKEFIKKNEATGFINEVIPLCYSTKLPIEEHILHMLDEFGKNNPLYYRIDNIQLFDIPCRSFA